MNLTTLALLRLTMGFIDATRIPDDFIMGVASSAYQIEGGWNEDGKGVSIWDTFTHENQKDTGDVACDSYHRYLEDIDMLKYLGVTHYRFSLSWPRILPNGDISNINPLGVQYYHNLIDALLVNNIQPMVTLYHWDLPQTLQDLGGWLNPDIVEYFANYARFIFNEYGSKVKYWFTINEPKEICLHGYGIGEYAPGIKSSGIADYQCGYYVLKAHAKAYHIYDDEFRKTQNGRVSFIIDLHWYEPASDSQQDKEAAERKMEFDYGIYANPIFHPNGNYPQIVIDRIDARSMAEGYNVSRLPKFTQTEIDYIKDTYDFFSLNTYFTYKVKWIADLPIDGSPSRDKDESVYMFQDSRWETHGNGWPIYPTGMRKLLNWIDQHYNHPEIIITENGYCDVDGRLNDDKRIDYYREHIRNVLLALYEDGVHVTGYLAWSFMDNLEWATGYSLKFGLYHVDFNDASRKRTIKNSGEYFKKLIATRRLDSSGVKMTSGATYWITFNESQQVCKEGYDTGTLAPGIVNNGIGAYQSTHNLLKAHAKAYHIYDKEYRPEYNGKVSFVVNCHWMEPATNNSEDIEAAERALQFQFGLYANPVYHPNGNYPQILIDRIRQRSLLEGFNTSRLP